MSRPANLRLTETAEIDLAEIWSYIAEETSESFAAEFLSRVGDRFTGLYSSRSPALPVPISHRICALSSMSSPYLPRPDEIIIVRVLHGSRDLASIAGEGGFAI